MSRRSRRLAPLLALVLSISGLFGLAKWAEPEPYDGPGGVKDIGISVTAQKAIEEAEHQQRIRDNQVVLTKRDPKVLFLGDSLTQGYGASDADKFDFVALTTRWLKAKGVKPTVVDAHFPGVEIGDAIERLETATPEARNLDLLIIELGTNNTRRGVASADSEQKYRELLDWFEETSPDALIMCLGPWGDPKQVGPINEAIEKSCKAAGGKFHEIDQHYTDRRNRNADGVRPDGRAIDTFHPSDRGYDLIATVITDALRLELKPLRPS